MIKNNFHKISTKIKPSYLFLFFLLIYFLTSAGNTPYDYFTRLADAFLNGKYWLTEPPPWLNELIPAQGGKFYVPYPPMPAILAIPFVAMFGKSFPQQLIAHLLGAGLGILVYRLSMVIKKDKLLALWASLLTVFGTIIWYLSSTGSVWYLGQVASAFFLTAAILSIYKEKYLLSGVFLGSAYLSRIHVLLSFPLFIYLAFKSKSRKSVLINITKLGVGILPFVFFNFLYNFLRFGVVWDIGYSLIPGVLNEPWYQHGLVHPSYIPRHLKIIFAGMPKIRDEVPYIQPSWAGLAIWMTTPAFIYSFLAPIRKGVVKVAWISIFLVSLPILMHGGTGFTQFGYRYAVDFYPLLILLTILGVSKSKLNKKHWLLLILSILVNLWGVLWINKFNWVSY